MNKRASVRDVILTAVLLFVFAMGFVVLYYISDEIVDNMILVPEINDSAGTVAALQSVDKIQARMDYVFLMVFVGLTLALLITSWFIAGNPLYIFIFFIVIIIGVVLSAILANVWDDFNTKAPVFATARANMPIANNIINNLPYYVSILGILSIVVTFAKPYLAARF